MLEGRGDDDRREGDTITISNGVFSRRCKKERRSRNVC